jgi:predicted ester cyclase
MPQPCRQSCPDLSIEYVTDDVVWHDGILGDIAGAGNVGGLLSAVPASGTAIQWNAVDIYRIRDGRISEEWAADDIAAIMNQLGAFSPPWLG